MKYLIFGGNGFVGRYLANKLIECGNNVSVFDIEPKLNENINKQCKFSSIDIRNRDGLRKIDIQPDDIVINMAATQYHTHVPHNRSEYFFGTNAVGTRNILEYTHAHGCRKYIMFTTDMTYGKPQYLPVDTHHPQNPFGPYGESKKECERICREFRQKGMNITIFRPRMINGPGRLGILVKLFKLMDLGLPVPTIGNGKNHYQMVSVFDCVDAVVAAIEKGLPNKEYNLGSVGSPDITTLLSDTIKSTGSHSRVIHTPGKVVKWVLGVLDKIGMTIMYPEQFMIADEEYVLDISETVADLDWNPQYNDADMLKMAYRMYKDNKQKKS